MDIIVRDIAVCIRIKYHLHPLAIVCHHFNFLIFLHNTDYLGLLSTVGTDIERFCTDLGRGISGGSGYFVCVGSCSYILCCDISADISGFDMVPAVFISVKNFHNTIIRNQADKLSVLTGRCTDIQIVAALCKSIGPDCVRISSFCICFVSVHRMGAGTERQSCKNAKCRKIYSFFHH